MRQTGYNQVSPREPRMITIHLYATFRMIAGKKTFELNAPGDCTVQQVIRRFLAEVPALSSHWVNGEGEVHAHVHAFVNGHDVTTLPEVWQTRLKSGDVLDFFPPVAGG